MKPSDVTNELKRAQKKPLLFGSSFLLLVVLICGTAWLTGFWGKKGEQFAESEHAEKTETIKIQYQSTNLKNNETKNTKFTFNKDFKKRDKIIGISVDWKKITGGTVHFDSMEFSTLDALFRNQFIDPQDRQNEAPRSEKFYNFLEIHKEIKTHGYAVSPYRKDYRVTLEGLILHKENISKDLKIAFFEFCKGADELDTNDDLYCWWD